MTIEHVLSLLDQVKPRGTGKYSARCPAHNDRSPSLSIREGDKGILAHCWAGCDLSSICASLGIKPADLFYGATSSRTQIAEARRRKANQHRQHVAADLTIDAMKAAEEFIRSRGSLDISQWSPERLDSELNALAVAYALLEGELHD